MEWQILKEKIYYFDGAWLDIYVQNTTQEDWSKWVAYVNDNYKLSFYNGQTETHEPKISFSTVTDYWSGKTDLCNDVTIELDKIIVKCYFFDDLEIENDIDTGDIKSIDDHYKLLSYLTDISKLLSKTVIVTPENTPEIILISAISNEIKINA